MWVYMEKVELRYWWEHSDEKNMNKLVEWKAFQAKNRNLGALQGKFDGDSVEIFGSNYQNFRSRAMGIADTHVIIVEKFSWAIWYHVGLSRKVKTRGENLKALQAKFDYRDKDQQDAIRSTYRWCYQAVEGQAPKKVYFGNQSEQLHWGQSSMCRIKVTLDAGHRGLASLERSWLRQIIISFNRRRGIQRELNEIDQILP